MKKSILQDEKECYICHTTANLQLHHCYFGTANRKLSDQDGCVVYLCVDHHTGIIGVHHNRDLDLALIQMAQKKFEETHTRDEWRALFTKSYL